MGKLFIGYTFINYTELLHKHCICAFFFFVYVLLTVDLKQAMIHVMSS